MKQPIRIKFVAFALIGAYLLSACGGTVPPSVSNENGAPKVLASEIVFTGIVEQINGDQWVVSGQAFTVDPAALMDSGIAVGDIVKVEGTVSADGSVVALTIESSIATDDNVNDDNSNGNANSNDENSNTGNSNGTDDNSNAGGDDQDEIFGVVDAITADSITIGGVVYQLADFTEFKDAISVGDQVKIHVIVNADGTFTIREIERSDGQGDDDNSNSGNENDDNGNDDNGNDDNGNDDSGGDNGNDDDSGHDGGDDDDDNGNDD